MTGLEGINSLQQALGTLGVKENRATDAASAQGAGATGSVAGAAAAVTDQARVSSAGGLAAQLSAGPDVRPEKVAQLQAAIASGTYNVPASAVADKLVAHLLGQ